MAVLNKTYYEGVDYYNDGDVEGEILSYVENPDNIAIDEFIGNDFAKAYHLSPIRENILNWYPFKKNENALEIGAGCGAITGMLCSRLGEVTSVELSLRRSSINYARNKDVNNLEIIVGNFNNIKLVKKYDYVVLNGVLEYAMMFTKTSKPFEDFLIKMAGYLKPNGKIIIAIENKLGLKYFNGSYEDHTNNYFEGINNYQKNDSVRTFSKTELVELLGKVGFDFTKFYYPYPDYKFPSEIYTDTTINIMGYGRGYINIEKDRMWLFEEQQVGLSLQKEKIRDIFANSFLVVASKNSFECNIEYAKLNNDRSEEFRIATIIRNNAGSKHVIKKSLTSAAVSHIDRLEKSSNSFAGEGIEFLKADRNEEGLIYKFLNQSNLAESKYSYDEQKEHINRFIDRYCSLLDSNTMDDWYNEKFIKWFGKVSLTHEELCVRNANIDLILDNIYLDRQKYIVIDSEWIFPDFLPKQFLLWRCVNEAFYNGVFNLSGKTYEETLLDFDIDLEDDKVYRNWSNHFASEYVGTYRRDRVAKEVVRVSLDDIRVKRNKTNEVLMKIYIDYGNGYSEDNTVCRMVELTDRGKFEVSFDIPSYKNVVGLRFDPIDGEFCKCKIDDISETAQILGNNAKVQEDEWGVFVNLDPQYYIETKSPKINIRGIVSVLEKSDVRNYL